MLTREEDIDVHALRRQGMSISAIARHLGRDRKTIRAYLAGGRVAGERKPAEAAPAAPTAAPAAESGLTAAPRRRTQAVPPTVRPSMRSVGCPTPTGTL